MPTGTTEAAGLFLYYKCDEASGSVVAVDSSGAGRDGSVTSGTVTGGKYGNAYSLAAGGSIGFASTPFAWGSACTFSIWALDNNTGGGTARGLFLDAAGANGFYVGSDGKAKFKDANGVVASGTSVASLFVWTHYVLVFEADGHARLCVNGVSEYYGGGYSVSGFSTSKVGSSASISGKGQVDEIKVYAGALTAAQVADLYATRATRGPRTTHAASASGTFLGVTAPHGSASPSVAHHASASASSAAPHYAASASAHAARSASASGSFLKDDADGDAAAPAPHSASASATFLSIDAHGDAAAAVGTSAAAAGSFDPPSYSGSAAGSATHHASAPGYFGVVFTLPASLPLIMNGSTGPGSFRGFNLAVTGGGVRMTGSLPLTLFNQAPATRGLRLLLRGPDGTPGSRPFASTMNLWAEWGGQGVLPLVLNAASRDGSLPLAVARGAGPGSGSLPVTIAAEGGVTYQGLELAIPAVKAVATLAGSAELAVPAAAGLAVAGLKTFINGWRKT